MDEKRLNHLSLWYYILKFDAFFGCLKLMLFVKHKTEKGMR